MAGTAIEHVERWVVQGTQGAREQGPALVRVATGLAGVGLLIGSRRTAWRVPGALLAGVVIARAVSGVSRFGSDPDRAMRTQEDLSGGRGEDVQEAITIAQPIDAVYGFWRTLSALGEATGGRISVTPVSPERSHWQIRARGGDGAPLAEWTAETVNDVPGKILGWRTTADADIPSAGGVHFAPAPDGHATEVHVHLRCAVPFGRFGATAAALGGHSPAMLVREALRDVKRYLELDRRVELST